MALLFVDSFDTTTTVARMAERYGASSTGFASLVTGRTGNAFRFGNNANYLQTRVLPTSGSTFIIGLGYKATAFDQIILRIYESATLHLYLKTNSSGNLLVYRGDNTLLGTSSTVLSISSWYYLEFKGAIHDSTGSFTVRIDGATFGGLTASSQDTRNGATGIWDSVMLGPNGGVGSQFDADDFYICDGSGSVNNDFLGNIKITAVLPQTDGVGGAGGAQEWTPSTGTDHGALVDEADPNSTDYVSSSTAGQRDTFNYPACGVTGTIKAVAVDPYTIKTDAGARTLKTVVRISSTNYDHAAAISPLTTYSSQPQIWETNPATTLAWTAGDIDGAEFGIKLES